MASVVVAGAGIASLATAMLLADDGHEVTVLERDPQPPADPGKAWVTWQRQGVNQFRLPHLFVSRFRAELEHELPRAVRALDEAGALRYNPLDFLPRQSTGCRREGDSDYEMLTGRRPVMEAVMAILAASTPGVRLRRGITVSGLVTRDSRAPEPAGTIQVTGVRTSTGEELTADLVVDATGRRSRLARWLRACGSAPPRDEAEDSGFVYYCRHFRSKDAALPAMLGPGMQEHGSVSSLTLPADNGTWAVVIVASAADRELRGLRDAGRWTAAVRAMPLIAHWIDAQPFGDQVAVIANIKDRHRSLVVDGQPVAAGVVALADAWACTNPSLGRGVSLGVMHGRVLRDTLRKSDTTDARRFALDFHQATATSVEPWYRATLHYDRHRLAEMRAHARGQVYEPDDPEWEAIRSLQFGARQDPGLLRCSLAIINTLRTPAEVLAEPGIRAHAAALGGSWRAARLPGPDRTELTAIAAS